MANNQNDKIDVDELYQAIIVEYDTTKSIAEIAKKLGTSQVRVQRVLITEGLWTSKRTEQIAELKAQGLSVEQMAEQLGKDVKTIQTFLPYSRGQYGKSETDDAARSKEYRDRMHAAAEGMIAKDEQSTIRNIEIDFDKALKNGANGSGNINVKPHTEEELESNPFLNSESVFRLRLELVDHFIYGGGEFFEADEKKKFLKLAKANEGIVREVLVPSTMNLHSMHYMIQRLFGWQNGHLHNFSIAKEQFDALTGGTVGGWQNLCGSLLHFTQDETTDFYWDDDYEAGESVKSWLKRKYVGPYKQKAVCESYFDTRRSVREFNKHFPQFVPKMTLDEMEHSVIMEESLNFLNERLTLGELFKKQATPVAEYPKWLEKLEKKKKKTEDKFNQLPERRKAALLKDAEQLQGWRRTLSAVEQRLYYGNAAGIKKETGRSAKQWREDALMMIPYLTEECDDLFTKYNPRLSPLFDTLFYEYDYGDGWCVKITVLDQYDRKTNADRSQSSVFAIDVFTEADKLSRYRYFQNGEEVDEELRAILAYVDAKERPRCIAADGLNVLDDVGGLGGFMDLIETLSGDDSEEKESMQYWARGQGWTGRKTKPENIL